VKTLKILRFGLHRKCDVQLENASRFNDYILHSSIFYAIQWRLKMKRKSIPAIRLTDEEYQLLLTMKMMLKTNSITETVKKCIFDPIQKMEELSASANQQYVNIQKQQHLMFKLCMAILLELTKHREFENPIEESKEKVIKRCIAAMKQEADLLYK
jgi:hypothetical protein